MSSLTDRVAYLRGLAEGMEIAAEEGKMGKLMLAVIEALGEAADTIQRLQEEHQELDEYVESIDDDLSEIEEALFDEEDDDDDEDEDDDDMIECECPHCGESAFFDPESFDLSGDHYCPNCGKPLFAESEGAETEEE